MIVTHIGGDFELITLRFEAILIQPENPEEIADAIVKIIYDKELVLRSNWEHGKNCPSIPSSG